MGSKDIDGDWRELAWSSNDDNEKQYFLRMANVTLDVRQEDACPTSGFYASQTAWDEILRSSQHRWVPMVDVFSTDGKYSHVRLQSPHRLVTAAAAKLSALDAMRGIADLKGLPWVAYPGWYQKGRGRYIIVVELAPAPIPTTGHDCWGWYRLVDTFVHTAGNLVLDEPNESPDSMLAKIDWACRMCCKDLPRPLFRTMWQRNRGVQ